MRRVALFAAALVAWPALSAWPASPRPELLEAHSLAMGGALRTIAGPTAAPRLNPAALGAVRGFFAGGSYATRRQGGFDAFSLTLVDNVTSPMGGAFQYLRFQGAEEREDMSLSLAAGRRGLWWGFTARFVHGSEDGSGAWEDVFTGDLGLLFERPGGLRIAVVGQDLPDTSLDFLERRIAVGVSHADLWSWTVAADVVRNLDRNFSRGVDLHLGAERPLGETPWRLRLGQLWRSDTGKDYASAGVGWGRDSVVLGYGVQKARQRAGEVLHVLSAEGSF